jgi:hypothetical protein
MLKTALKLAASGMHVFPIKPNSKIPAIKDWQGKATTDVEQITKWWSGQGYDRNIGIATEPSGLIVIDIDTKGKNGKENFQKLMDTHGATDTLTVTTPSDGAHLYYTAPGSTPLRSTVSKLAEGVDTRAHGGYVVAENSKTPQGTYERVIDMDIAPCPVWVVPLLKGTKVSDPKTPTSLTLDIAVDCMNAVQYLRDAPPAIQGQGGDHLTYGICCELHDMGISIETGVDLLATHWNDKCSPAWTLDELQTKMSNAYDFAQSSPGCKSLDLGAVKSAPKQVHCVADMNLDIPPRDWLLESRLISGYVTVTVAPGGEGKSMYTMLEAIAVATGKPLTGITPSKRGGVLIYNTEDPQDEIERRILAICIEYKIDPKSLTNVFYVSGVQSPLRFAVSDRGRAIPTRDREKLQKIIEENNIILTLIDPFVRCHSVDENSNVDIDLVVQQMSSLALSTSSAISVIHHMNKRGTSASYGDAESSRGASSLSSAARIVSTIMSPTVDECEGLKIPEGKRRNYLRVDRAKGNMTAPSDKPVWFEKISVLLPNDDSVGTIRITTLTGGVQAVVEDFSDMVPMNVLEIVAPYMGIGECPTDDIVLSLAELVPGEFKGMGLAVRKEKFIRLFSEGVGNDTFRITADDKVTKIQGVLPW